MVSETITNRATCRLVLSIAASDNKRCDADQAMRLAMHYMTSRPGFVAGSPCDERIDGVRRQGLTVEWASREAMDSYLASAHFGALLSLAEVSTGPLKTSFELPGERQGAEYLRSVRRDKVEFDLTQSREAIAPTGRQNSPGENTESPQSSTLRTPALAEVIRDHILEVLNTTDWRIRGTGGAAEILGLRPNTLDSRIAKMGIRRPEVDPAARDLPRTSASSEARDAECRRAR
jgi:hypothetical protein